MAVSSELRSDGDLEAEDGLVVDGIADRELEAALSPS